MKNLLSASSWKAALTIVCVVAMLGGPAWSQQKALPNPALQTEGSSGWNATPGVNCGVAMASVTIPRPCQGFGPMPMIVHSVRNQPHVGLLHARTCDTETARGYPAFPDVADFGGRGGIHLRQLRVSIEPIRNSS